LLEQNPSVIDLAFVAAVTLPTGAAHDYLREGFTASPSLVVGHRFSEVYVAGELGYTARGTTMLGASTIDDEIFARIGTAYAVSERVDVAASVAFATAAAHPLRDASYLELLGGPTVRISSHASVFALGGAGLQDGFGAPDWRMLAGARYRPD